MEKWEYKIMFVVAKGIALVKLDPETEQKMNELGAEGWEFTSASPFAGSAAGTSSFVFIFKRQKA